VLIREARPDEYERIGALTAESYAALGAGHYSDWYGERLRDVARRASDAVVLVAVDDDGTILGNVTYVGDPVSSSAEFTDPDAAGMRMLAVSVGAQGRGVGRALVDAVLDRARADGKRRVLLHTTDFMPVARKLYASLGFVRDVTMDFVPEPGTSLFGYRYELGGR
jgi:GNAT superfamily N-acetyltransferase